jgi:hypothetical protein
MGMGKFRYGYGYTHILPNGRYIRHGIHFEDIDERATKVKAVYNLAAPSKKISFQNLNHWNIRTFN